MAGRSQTGLVACTSIDDYVAGKIKKHEFTRPEKEIDRINHILACDANTSPIFLSYRQPAAVKEAVDAWQAEHAPIYDFVSYHEVQHRVWLIDDPALVASFAQQFQAVDALYIADGHHRTESAVKVGLQKRADGQSRQESDRFLAILFPENELAIWEYNRVLRVPVPENFFEQAAQHFTIRETTRKKPAQRGSIHLYLNHAWWELTIKPKLCRKMVGQLDVSLYNNTCWLIFSRSKMCGQTNALILSAEFVVQKNWNVWWIAENGHWPFPCIQRKWPIFWQSPMREKLCHQNQLGLNQKLLSGLFLHDLETN